MLPIMYSVGFLFDTERKHVLLIKKEKPEWQKGCLNGIGGKNEARENPIDTMNRECFEECGLEVGWRECGVMLGKNNDGSKFICYIFKAFDNIIYHYQQKESEQLAIYDVSTALKEPHIKNLEFLIPYCLCNDHSKYITIEY